MTTATAAPRMVMAVAFAAVVGAIGIAPAHGRDDERKGDRHDARHGDRDRREHRPVVYSQPVYAPPPVYSAPPPSPGISLFLPLNIRIR